MKLEILQPRKGYIPKKISRLARGNKTLNNKMSMDFIIKNKKILNDIRRCRVYVKIIKEIDEKYPITSVSIKAKRNSFENVMQKNPCKSIQEKRKPKKTQINSNDITPIYIRLPKQKPIEKNSKLKKKRSSFRKALNEDILAKEFSPRFFKAYIKIKRTEQPSRKYKATTNKKSVSFYEHVHVMGENSNFSDTNSSEEIVEFGKVLNRSSTPLKELEEGSKYIKEKETCSIRDKISDFNIKDLNEANKNLKTEKKDEGENFDLCTPFNTCSEDEEQNIANSGINNTDHDVEPAEKRCSSSKSYDTIISGKENESPSCCIESLNRSANVTTISDHTTSKNLIEDVQDSDSDSPITPQIKCIDKDFDDIFNRLKSTAINIPEKNDDEISKSTHINNTIKLSLVTDSSDQEENFIHGSDVDMESSSKSKSIINKYYKAIKNKISKLSSTGDTNNSDNNEILTDSKNIALKSNSEITDEKKMIC